MKTKSRTEVTEWFKEQWAEIELYYFDEFKAGKLDRLKEMFDGLTGERKIHFDNYLQRPYSFYLPRLPTSTFFNADQFRLVQVLEQNYETIKTELLNIIKEDEGFTEYLGDGVETDKGKMTSRGEWKVFHFFKQFEKQDENCSRCPQTTAILESLKAEGSLLAGMVCFSSLLAGSRIVSHTGPSNMRLTCHLGLIGCKGAYAKVGCDVFPFLQGKCIVFDDSYVHEVWHDGEQRRVTLMLDMWHPELLPVEIEAFQTVINSASKFMDPDEFFHSLKLVD